MNEEVNNNNESFISIKKKGEMDYYDFNSEHSKKMTESDKRKSYNKTLLNTQDILGEQKVNENKIDDLILEEKVNKAIKIHNKEVSIEQLKKDNEFHHNKIIFVYTVSILTSFSILVFLFFYIHFGTYQVQLLVNEKEFNIPLIDDRKYRAIRLANNLDILLISDLNTPRSSASMTVGVGSFQDPEHFQGLAHLLEHMIFLGSKSYPKPNDFEDFIGSFLGITNAYTEDQKTTFFFEVGNKGFSKSLLMFSRMFVEPLLDVKLMRKEIDGVNSEHQKNLIQDNWKEHQLLKTLANSKHPYSKFNTGNHETFKGKTIEEMNKKLNELYNQFYQARNMKLVVLSNQNLNQIEETVINYFSDIKEDIKQKRPLYGVIRSSEQVYSESDLGKIIWYKKTSTSTTLDVIFTNVESRESLLNDIDKAPINGTPLIFRKKLKINRFKKLDDVEDDDGKEVKFSNNQNDDLFTEKSNYPKYTQIQRVKPSDYLSYLLRYSGKGSLIDYLKIKKFATKIESGMILNYNSFWQYAISITLTKEGLENNIKVIDALFSYLNKVRSSPINEDYYKELQEITKVQFMFQEKNDRYGEFTSQLSNNMFDYPYKEILISDYLHSNFNKKLINEFISNIIPEKCLIMLGSNNYLSTDSLLYRSFFAASDYKTEAYYNTIYIDSNLEPKTFKILKNSKVKNFDFSLRTKNNYITREKQMSTCVDDNLNNCQIEFNEKDALLVISKSNLQIWHKLDRSFKIPKANIYLNLVSSFLRTKEEQFVNFLLYSNFLQLFVDINFSDAKYAGNEINLEFTENGITIFISVFTDLMPKMIDEIFNLIYLQDLDNSTYDSLVLSTIEQIQQISTLSVYDKAKINFSKILKLNFISFLDLSNYTETKFYNYAIFKTQMLEIRKSLKINSLFYGNIKLDVLKLNFSLIDDYMSLKKQSRIKEMKLINKEEAVKSIIENSPSLETETSEVNDDEEVGLSAKTIFDFFRFKSKKSKISIVDGNKKLKKVSTKKAINSFLSILNTNSTALSNFYTTNIATDDQIELLNEKFIDDSYITINSDLKSLNITDSIKYLHKHFLVKQPIIFELITTENSGSNIVMNYFQVGNYSVKNYLYMSLVQMLWGNMFNYYLNTVEKLGSIIVANKEILDNKLYFSFVVTGMSLPQKMDLEIDKVLSLVKAKLDELTLTKLSEVKNLLKYEISKKDLNLKQKSDFVWNEIYEQSYYFKRQENLRHYLKLITVKEIRNFFDSTFIENPQKLSIYFYSDLPSLNESQNKIDYYYLNSNKNLIYTKNLSYFSDQFKNK